MEETTEAISTASNPIDRLTAKRNAVKAAQSANNPVNLPIQETTEATPTEEKPSEEKTDLTNKSSEKVAEAKASEEKPVEEKKEKKPKFEKHWASKTEPKAEAESKTTDQADPKVAESSLSKAERDELAALRSLISKPSVKKILQAEESGKDFDTYYEELKSRDPYKMPYRDLYKAQLEEQGLNKAEVDRKMERFGEMDEDDQLDRVATFRKNLKEKFDKEINDWTPKIEKQANPWEELDQPYQETAKKFENKKLYGITATPEMVKEAAEFYKNNSLINLNEKGQLDPEDLFKKTFLIKNIDIIFDSIYQGGHNDGFEESEIANGVGEALPSKNGASTPQPRSEQSKSDQQKRIDNLKASLPQA